MNLNNLNNLKFIIKFIIKFIEQPYLMRAGATFFHYRLDVASEGKLRQPKSLTFKRIQNFRRMHLNVTACISSSDLVSPVAVSDGVTGCYRTSESEVHIRNEVLEYNFLEYS